MIARLSRSFGISGSWQVITETFPTGPLGYPLMFRLRQNACRAALCPTDMVDAGMSGVSRADCSPTQNSSTQIYKPESPGLRDSTFRDSVSLRPGAQGCIDRGYRQTAVRQ